MTFQNMPWRCYHTDARKKALAIKFKICYIIDTNKRAAAHKGLAKYEDSNATHLPAKVSGWLLLCRATYKM